MRILLHDYSGHPFQAQLSRELARRGHKVWHVYSADFQTPKGKLTRLPDDPPGLVFVGLTAGEVFQKSTFVKRRAQEQAYGRQAAEHVRTVTPDIVISSNAPLDAQIQIMKAARQAKATFIFWIQDIYSEAISRILKRKLGVFGGLIGLWYRRLEFAMLRSSDAVVAITEDFVPLLTRNGVEPSAVHVVENWAPLEDIPASPAVPPEAGRAIRFLYSGTLGYKHNPGLLLNLAAALPVKVIVHSEGSAAEDLARSASAQDLKNLTVLPWVAFDDLPATLQAADVLITIIEADAGAYSVPSKILTYMCAGRPVLAAIPPENLAARIIDREGAGLVSPSSQEDAFIANAKRLMNDEQLRKKMGEQARAYADGAFDITVLGSRFDLIINQARGAVRIFEANATE